MVQAQIPSSRTANFAALHIPTCLNRIIAAGASHVSVLMTPANATRRSGVTPTSAMTDCKDLHAATDRKGYDLADFFLLQPAPRETAVWIPCHWQHRCHLRQPVAPAGIPTDKKSSSSSEVNSSGAGKKATPCSFSAIQKEEELVKRNSNMTNLKGNEMCPWNVERRARAESIEEVIRREKQDQLELEEQMEKFAEMERLEKQKEKEKAAAKR
eukprot:gene35702-46312_t